MTGDAEPRREPLDLPPDVLAFTPLDGRVCRLGNAVGERPMPLRPIAVGRGRLGGNGDREGNSDKSGTDAVSDSRLKNTVG
jgi:hypothetical protein